MTTRELIQGCLAGHAPSQKALFDRFAPKMYSVCLRYARHSMEAEDLLQDAFIKVYNKLGDFRHQGSFEGWVRRIVVNTAIKNYQRKRYKQEVYGEDFHPDLPVNAEAYAQLGESELLGLIAELPEGYRVVFNLYAIEGYSHREISQLLKIQESTSRSQLVKARKLLQCQIEKLHRIAI